MKDVVVNEIKIIDESVYQKFKIDTSKTEDYLNQYEINKLKYHEKINAIFNATGKESYKKRNKNIKS